MNELDLSIIDPYTGKETLPVLSYEELIDNRFCIEPIVNQNILRYKFHNEKGYRFFTKPCLCYLEDNKYEIHTENVEELFNNDLIINFKKDIIHQNYKNCSTCERYKNFKNGSISSFDNVSSFVTNYGFYAKHFCYNRDNIDDYPLYSLSLNISEVCNLKCKTCRKDYITKEPDLTDEDFNNLLKHIKKVKRLKIGCDGETFFSKTYMKFLNIDLTENSELEYIEIFTNGTCMTPNRLKEIHPNNWKIIKEFRISIDAATKETYMNVRGTNQNQWDSLLKNIQYVKDNYNVKLASCYTISKLNYKESLDFIDFAKNLGFTEIVFSFAKPRLKDKDKSLVLEQQYRKDIIDTINEIVFYKSKDINVVMI